MKKLLKKVRVGRKKAQAPESPQRITNETVAEHRERILAGGRKFKYPVQYSRHKLVINSVLIVVAALLVFTLIGWWQLYSVQNTSKFMYRVTQLIPVPVASVDGAFARYSDYLKRYRSSIHFLQKNNSINIRTDEGRRQAEYHKRRELDATIKDAYVKKVAAQHKVSVSDEEVNRFISAELDVKKVSLDAYERTILNNFYDWSLDDYLSIVKSELLRRKLSFEIDTVARDKATRLKQAATAGDFAEVAKAESDDANTKAAGGVVGSVPVSNQDANGVIKAALALEPGQVSSLIEGADGYYIVKLTSKDAVNVQYSVIKIALTELDRRFEEVKSQNKVTEFIKVGQQ